MAVELTRKEEIAELPTMAKTTGMKAGVEAVTLFLTPLRGSAAEKAFITEGTSIKEAHEKAALMVTYIATALLAASSPVNLIDTTVDCKVSITPLPKLRRSESDEASGRSTPSGTLPIESTSVDARATPFALSPNSINFAWEEHGEQHELSIDWRGQDPSRMIQEIHREHRRNVGRRAQSSMAQEVRANEHKGGNASW